MTNYWFFIQGNFVFLIFSFLLSFIRVLILEKLIDLVAIQHCKRRIVCKVLSTRRKTGKHFVFLVLFKILKQLTFTVCMLDNYVKPNSKHSMNEYIKTKVDIKALNVKSIS